jgi:hypothetical protein
MSYESPKRFVRWQPDFVKPSCQFVFRQAIGGRRFPVSTRLASVNLASLAGHKICFHESHINLAVNVVPIGCFFGGFPPPPVTFPATRLGFLQATLLTISGSSLMVATRFYPGAQKTFRSSWQAFRLQLRASLASANRSAFTLSQSLATPFADPFVGLKSRNLRDTDAYTENKFAGQFFV